MLNIRLIVWTLLLKSLVESFGTALNPEKSQLCRPVRQSWRDKPDRDYLKIFGTGYSGFGTQKSLSRRSLGASMCLNYAKEIDYLNLRISYIKFQKYRKTFGTAGKYICLFLSSVRHAVRCVYDLLK